jgi:hypothetical protein
MINYPKARDLRASVEASTPEYDPRMAEASRLADAYDIAEATLDYTPRSLDEMLAALSAPLKKHRVRA